MNDVVLMTIHGSHLYGLNHSGSDEDWYAVDLGRGRKSRHTTSTELDVSVRGLSTFMRHILFGVPQALEAAFSEHVTRKVDPRYEAMLSNLWTGGSTVTETYERVMYGMRKGGTFKLIRHSYRLRLNLDDIHRYGRFNPTLNPDQIDWVNKKATEDYGTNPLVPRY